MEALVDKLRQLLELLGRFFELLAGKKCVCLTPEEYDELIKELDNAIAQLEDWLKKAESGELGAEKPG